MCWRSAPRHVAASNKPSLKETLPARYTAVTRARKRRQSRGGNSEEDRDHRKPAQAPVIPLVAPHAAVSSPQIKLAYASNASAQLECSIKFLLRNLNYDRGAENADKWEFVQHVLERYLDIACSIKDLNTVVTTKVVFYNPLMYGMNQMIFANPLREEVRYNSYNKI